MLWRSIIKFWFQLLGLDREIRRSISSHLITSTFRICCCLLCPSLSYIFNKSLKSRWKPSVQICVHSPKKKKKKKKQKKKRNTLWNMFSRGLLYKNRFCWSLSFSSFFISFSLFFWVIRLLLYLEKEYIHINFVSLLSFPCVCVCQRDYTGSFCTFLFGLKKKM